MINETIKTTLGKSTNKQLLKVQIKRTAQGTKLYMKSEMFESYFKPNGISVDNYITNNDSSRIKSYMMSIDNVVNDRITQSLNVFNSSLKTRDGYTNLGFLKAVGLKDGLTFDITGVYSKTGLNDFMTELKKDVRKIYEEEMRPEILSVEFRVIESDF